MTDLGGKDPTTNQYYSDLLVETNAQGLIDYSFIAKTQTKKANTLAQTNSSGVLNLDLLPASTTPKANSIPISTTGGSGSSTIANGWINSTVSDATPDRFVLTSSTGLIDNNLLKKSSSSAANTLVAGDSNGKISDNWLVTTNNGLDNPNGLLKLNNGKIGVDVIPDDKYVPISGGITDGNILINGPSPNANTHKTVSNGKTVYTGLTNLKGVLPNFVGIGGNSYQDGFLVGMNGSSNANNYLMIATYDEGNEPIYVRQYTGNPGYSGLTQSKSITLMDANGNTSVNTLTVTNNITSTSGIITTNGTGTNVLKGSLSVDKTSTLKGNVTIGNSSTASTLTTYGTGYFVKTTDLSGIANNKPALIVGGTDTSAHLEIDSNEIQAKADGTNPATIGINLDGGNISIGNNDKNTVVTLRKNTSITGTASIAGNATVGSSSSRSTLTSYGLVTADNGLTVNNAVLTANKGATIKGALLDAQAGAKTTTLLTTSTATIGASASAPANLHVYGTSALDGNVGIGTSTSQAHLRINNGMILIDKKNNTSGITTNIKGQVAGNDFWRIATGATASDAGYLEIAVGDNGNEPIYFRQYSGTTSGVDVDADTWGTNYRTLTLMDASGNTELPGTLKVKGTGDSSFAGKLTTGSLGTGAITSTGITNTGTFSNTGTASIGGLLTANGRISIPTGGNVVSASYNNPHLTLGSSTGVHIEIDNNEIAAKTDAGTVGTLYLQDGGGGVTIGGGEGLATLTVNGDTTATGKITAKGGIAITGSGDKINSTGDTSALLTIGTATGNHLSFDEDEISSRSNASGGLRTLYLQPDGGSISIGENLSSYSSYTTSIKGNLKVYGTSTSDGLLTANGGVYIPITGDKVTVSDSNSVPLLIGSKTGQHLEFDNNEITAKSNASTMSDLNLNPDGGELLVFNRTAGSMRLTGTMTVDGKFYIKADGQTSNAYDNPNEPIRVKFKNKNGNYTFFGGKGPTVVGGGEGAYELYDYWFNTNSRNSDADPNRYQTKATPNFEGRHTPKNNGTIEDDILVLTSDQNVYIHTNVQENYENRKEWEFRNNGELICPGSVTASNIPSTGVLPIPNSTSNAIGEMFTGYGRYHTLPSGGTWFWWACCFNANSTSIGPKWGIAAGGSEIDLEYDNRRAQLFATRIKSS